MACGLAVGLTYFLYKADLVPAWTGRTIIRVGLAPPPAFLLLENGPPLAPIESPRAVVARISDPVFRAKVINRVSFEEPGAPLSKGLASSSLRAVALDSERDVAVEVSAGSRADVENVLRALMAEIERVHGEMARRTLDILVSGLADVKSRIAAIEKSSADLSQQTLSGGSDSSDIARSAVLAPSLARSIATWDKLKDREQRDANLLSLSEKTVVYAESDTYPITQRSIGALKASILAGLAMLAFMIILTVLIRPAQKAAD